MEYVWIIVIIVVLIIYLLAKDSKKETKKEQYGEAVGQLAQMTADKIGGIANTLTEPKDKKNIRLARESLAYKNGCLYRFNRYSDKEYLKRLLTVDKYFKESLDILGLSEEKWETIAQKLLFIGVIRQLSRDHLDYSRRNEKFIREHMVNNWINEPMLKADINMLYTALEYFNIKKEEWIEYGDVVVEMYNLCDSPDMKRFGIISSIKPMKNNRHLL